MAYWVKVIEGDGGMHEPAKDKVLVKMDYTWRYTFFEGVFLFA